LVSQDYAKYHGPAEARYNSCPGDQRDLAEFRQAKLRHFVGSRDVTDRSIIHQNLFYNASAHRMLLLGEGRRVNRMAIKQV